MTAISRLALIAPALPPNSSPTFLKGPAGEGKHILAATIPLTSMQQTKILSRIELMLMAPSR
jgi:hypothetical protein